MERIGIAASKIAKGNLFVYNIFVILLASLFAVLVFFIAGCSIVIVLIVIAFLTNRGASLDFEQRWMPVMMICVSCLAIVVGSLNLVAICKNIKLKKNK